MSSKIVRYFCVCVFTLILILGLQVTYVNTAETDYVGDYISLSYEDGWAINNITKMGIDTNYYKMVFDFKNGKMVSFKNKSSSSSNYLSTNGAYVSATSGGNTYTSLTSQTNSSVYVSRTGKTYYQIRMGNMRLKNGTTDLGVNVVWELYCWPDKVYSAVYVTPDSGSVAATNVNVVYNYNSWTDKYQVSGGSLTSFTTPYSGTPDGVALINDAASGYGSMSHVWSDKTNISSIEISSSAGINTVMQRYAPAGGSFSGTKTMYHQVASFADGTTSSSLAGIAIENNPITSSDITISGSRNPTFIGFNKINGTYQFNMPGLDINLYNSNYYYYQGQNVYDDATITMNNNASARKMRIQISKNPAGRELPTTVAVLTDINNYPVGVPIQVSTNWDNPGYVEGYFAIPLTSSQSKTYKVRWSYQDWGKHTNVTFSSQDVTAYPGYSGQTWLNFSNGYVMGGSCEDPYTNRSFGEDNASPNAVGAFGPSFMWKRGVHGWDFLNYRTGGVLYYSKMGAGNKFIYDQIGPSNAKYSGTLSSGDYKVTTTLSVSYPVSDDAYRKIIKVRYDFNSAMTIADPGKDLRLFTLGNKDGDANFNFPTQIAYKNTNGTTSYIADNSTSFPVVCQALNTSYPYVQTVGSTEADFALLVRSASGTLAGQSLSQLAFTWEKQATYGTTLVHIVPNRTGSININAGDYIELEMILLVNGRDLNTANFIEAEHAAWGSNYQTSVTTGTLISNYPTQVNLAANGIADFTVTGGKNFVPIIVSGFSSYVNPRLYENVKGSWILVDQSVNGNDFWQNDYDPVSGKYSITYSIKNEDGGTRTFKAMDNGSGNPPSNTYSGSSIDGLVSPYSLSYPRYAKADAGFMKVTAQITNIGTNNWDTTNKVYFVVEAFGVKNRIDVGSLASHSSKNVSINLDILQKSDEYKKISAYLEKEDGALISNKAIDHTLLFPVFTRVDDADPSITYSGTWYNASDPNSYQSTYKYSNITGAFAQFSFVGTDIKIIGITQSNLGKADVYIDGVLDTADIDLYNASLRNQGILYLKGGMAYGTHTIKFVVKGTKNPSSSGYWIILDAFEYRSYANITTASPIANDTNPSMTYSGTWHDDVNVNDVAGTNKYSNTTNGYVQYTFSGTSVKLIGRKSSNLGKINVYIDGVLDTSGIDLYNPTALYQQELFTKSGLSSGNHTIKVVITGTKNANSSGYWFIFDAISASIQKFDSTDTAVTYVDGVWTHITGQSNDYGTTLSYSKTTNGYVQSTFRGTTVNISVRKQGNCGIVDVYIDGILDTAGIDTYSSSIQYQQVIYTKSGLSDEVHTIKVVITGTKNTSSTDYYLHLDAIEVLR